MENKTEQQVPQDLLDSVGEKLPTFEEIERYAKDGTPPKSCAGSQADCAASILMALTRKIYPPYRAEKLWRAIVRHEKWLRDRIGRRPGISVAALDYLATVICCHCSWRILTILKRSMIPMVIKPAMKC